MATGRCQAPRLRSLGDEPPRGMRLWHQRDSRDARNAVIAPGMIAFRLGGFAWTPAHENHQPNFLQRRESFVDRFQRGLDETPYDPRSSPPRHRSDIHQHHSAPSRRPFAAGPLRLPCPHLSGAGLPRSTDRHFGDGHICSWSPSRLLACLRFPSHGQAARRPGPACVLLPVPVMPERVPTMRPCNSKGIRIYIRI
jgi:hypothetical protein